MLISLVAEQLLHDQYRRQGPLSHGSMWAVRGRGRGRQCMI